MHLCKDFNTEITHMTRGPSPACRYVGCFWKGKKKEFAADIYRMSRKKIRMSGFFWKSKDLAPLGCLVPPGQHRVVATPLWTARELSGWSPSTAPVGAPRLHGHLPGTSVMCSWVLWQSVFLCTLSPTESRQMKPDEEGPVFQEKEQSGFPMGWKTTS